MNKTLTAAIVLLLTINIVSQTWHKSDQPEGGDIHAIDCSPLDSSQIVIMAGRYLEHLIYYSKDAGNSWSEIGMHDNVFFKGQVKIDPVNNRIYASNAQKVEVTTDLGLIWFPLFQKTGFIWDMQLNPNDPSELLLTHDDGIYRSSDFGKSWDLVYPVASNVYIDAIRYSPVKTSSVMVQGSSEIFLSTDSGITWNRVAVPYSNYYQPVLFDPLDENILYAIYNSEPWDSLFTERSTDLGTTWNILNENYRSFDLCYKENNQRVFVSGGNDGIYRSSDYGYSWQSFSPALNCDYVTYNGEKLFANFPSQGFAMHISDNIWSFRNRGIAAWQPNSVSITNSAKLFSTYYNTYRKQAALSSWEGVLPQLAVFNVDFYDSKIGFCSSYYNMYKTTDGGASWFTFPSPGFPKKIQDMKVIGEYIFIAVDDSYPGIYRSSVTQGSWTKIADGYNSKIMYDGSYLYFFAKEWNGPLVFVRSAASGYNIEVLDTLDPLLDYTAFARKDNPPGILLGAISKDAPPLGNYPGILYFINQNGEKTILLDEGGIYSVAAPKGRKEFYIMKHARGSILKADSIGGEFYLVEEGLPYMPNGQGGTSLYYFDVPGYEDKLYTDRGGWMELDLEPVVTSAGQEDITNDLQFNLSQNYPNPFNPSTTIEYSVKEPSFVSLKVYNVLGRETAVLVNEDKSPGRYSVMFNAKGLASGIYFYQLKTGAKSLVKNMIMLR